MSLIRTWVSHLGPETKEGHAYWTWEKGIKFKGLHSKFEFKGLHSNRF